MTTTKDNECVRCIQKAITKEVKFRKIETWDEKEQKYHNSYSVVVNDREIPITNGLYAFGLAIEVFP